MRRKEKQAQPVLLQCAMYLLHQTIFNYLAKTLG